MTDSLALNCDPDGRDHASKTLNYSLPFLYVYLHGQSALIIKYSNYVLS